MGEGLKKFDVVIVGAGVIGSALSLELDNLGYRIALLDIRPPSYAPSSPERVIALSEGSSRYLKHLGVWDAVIAPGVGNIRNIMVREPDNDGLVEMSNREIQSDSLGYVLEIRHVLKPIQEALKGRVEQFCPAQCTGFSHLADGTVQIEVKTEQGELNFQAAMLIGADGTNSMIRQMAGINTHGWDHNRVGIVSTIEAVKDHGDIAYECFRQEGPLALLPLAGGKFSLVWSVAPKHGVELMNLSDEQFLKAIELELDDDLLASIGSLKATSKRELFPLELRIADTFARKGVVLVGNAAHTIHPIAGQGMNLGFRDVVTLVDVMSKPWAKANLTTPLIMQSYAERRRMDILAVAGFTEGVLESFSFSLAPLRLLRGKGLDMVQQTPALKQLLLQQAAGLGQLKGAFDER